MDIGERFAFPYAFRIYLLRKKNNNQEDEIHG